MGNNNLEANSFDLSPVYIKFSMREFSVTSVHQIYIVPPSYELDGALEHQTFSKNFTLHSFF